MVPSHAAQTPGFQNRRPRRVERAVDDRGREGRFVGEREFLEERRGVDGFNAVALRRADEEMRRLAVRHRERFLRRCFLARGRGRRDYGAGFLGYGPDAGAFFVCWCAGGFCG